MEIPYIASSLKKARFNVFNLNFNHLEGSVEILVKERILRDRIDVVATGGLSFRYKTKKIVDAAKSASREVLGLRSELQRAAKCPGIDNLIEKRSGSFWPREERTGIRRVQAVQAPTSLPLRKV